MSFTILLTTTITIGAYGNSHPICLALDKRSVVNEGSLGKSFLCIVNPELNTSRGW
jgi:hypothetical protein